MVAVSLTKDLDGSTGASQPFRIPSVARLGTYEDFLGPAMRIAITAMMSVSAPKNPQPTGLRPRDLAIVYNTAYPIMTQITETHQ